MKKAKKKAGTLFTEECQVSIQFSNNCRDYTYKSWFKPKVGDHVVVEPPSGELTVVKVIEIYPPKHTNVATKWIVCRVDTNMYERIKAEEELAALNTRMKKLRKEMGK